MTTRFDLSRFPSIKLRAGLIPFICVYLWSCTPAPTPTPFIPPTAPAPLIEPTFIIQPTREVVTTQSTPLPTIAIAPTLTPTPTPPPGECVNSLRFISDLTVPDNSTITYGATIDKQWLVENNGTCHWGSSYRLKFVGGAALGAPAEIALYPARAGTQATIQILFTAPFTDGIYESAWQAYDPNGNPFGSVIFIRIEVVPP